MSRYEIVMYEVYKQVCTVEAESKKQAIELAMCGEAVGDDTEYVRTLENETKCREVDK